MNNSFDELSERLLRRYRDVPNVGDEDAGEWIETSMNAHGFNKGETIPSEYASLIMLYAEATGATQLSIKTAHYFSFVDKDESIDKTNIAAEYRRIARDLWRNYNRRKEESQLFSGGSVMSFMKRVDRP